VAAGVDCEVVFAHCAVVGWWEKRVRWPDEFFVVDEVEGE